MPRTAPHPVTLADAPGPFHTVPQSKTDDADSADAGGKDKAKAKKKKTTRDTVSAGTIQQLVRLVSASSRVRPRGRCSPLPLIVALPFSIRCWVSGRMRLRQRCSCSCPRFFSQPAAQSCFSSALPSTQPLEDDGKRATARSLGRRRRLSVSRGPFLFGPQVALAGSGGARVHGRLSRVRGLHRAAPVRCSCMTGTDRSLTLAKSPSHASSRVPLVFSALAAATACWLSGVMFAFSALGVLYLRMIRDHSGRTAA